jgi:adenosine kinase
MFLGCIGNDSYGTKIQDELNKAGVKSLLEVREDIKSSRCGVGIHLKERCLLPQIRASTMLSTEFVQKNLDTISEASILLIEGYFVIEKYDIIQYLTKHFHTHNKKVAFTLSATFMVENFHDKMLEVSNQSHIIFCNNEEATIFSKNDSEDFEEVSASIHKMLTPMDRILVITCGHKPVVISKFDYKQNKLDFVLKSFVYPVDNEEIVDTNGCGDSFVGGFLSQYIKGESLEKCARAGNWASSVIIRNVGCTYPDNVDKQQF